MAATLQVRTRAMAKHKPPMPPPPPPQPQQALTPQQRGGKRAAALLQQHFSGSAAETEGLAALRRIAGTLAPQDGAAAPAAAGSAAFQELVDLLVDPACISAYELQASAVVPSIIQYIAGRDLHDDAAILDRLQSAAGVLLAQRYGDSAVHLVARKLVSTLETMEDFDLRIKPAPSFQPSAFARGQPANLAAMSLYQQGLYALSQPVKLMLRPREGSQLSECQATTALVEPLAKLSAVEDFLYSRWQSTRRSAAAAAQRREAAASAAAKAAATSKAEAAAAAEQAAGSAAQGGEAEPSKKKRGKIGRERKDSDSAAAGVAGAAAVQLAAGKPADGSAAAQAPERRMTRSQTRSAHASASGAAAPDAAAEAAPAPAPTTTAAASGAAAVAPADDAAAPNAAPAADTAPEGALAAAGPDGAEVARTRARSALAEAETHLTRAQEARSAARAALDAARSRAAAPILDEHMLDDSDDLPPPDHGSSSEDELMDEDLPFDGTVRGAGVQRLVQAGNPAYSNDDHPSDDDEDSLHDDDEDYDDGADLPMVEDLQLDDPPPARAGGGSVDGDAALEAQASGEAAPAPLPALPAADDAQNGAAAAGAGGEVMRTGSAAAAATAAATVAGSADAAAGVSDAAAAAVGDAGPSAREGAQQDAAGGSAGADDSTGAAADTGGGTAARTRAPRSALHLNRSSLSAAHADAEGGAAGGEGSTERRVVLLLNGQQAPANINVLQAVHMLQRTSNAYEHSGAIVAAQHTFEYALASEAPVSQAPADIERATSLARATPTCNSTPAYSAPTCSREQHLLSAIAAAASADGSCSTIESSNGCLVLMRMLETISAERQHFAAARSGAAGSPSSHMASPPLPPAADEAFFSMWTNARLLQQLNDVVAICGHGLPAWLHSLPQRFKCLLPFESRRKCASGCVALSALHSLQANSASSAPPAIMLTLHALRTCSGGVSRWRAAFHPNKTIPVQADDAHRVRHLAHAQQHGPAAARGRARACGRRREWRGRRQRARDARRPAAPPEGPRQPHPRPRLRPQGVQHEREPEEHPRV